jgi:hypothetical protein
VSLHEALSVLALVGVHLSAGHLRHLEGAPRSRWLSAAGGVSVAYVFVHVLPEVARADESIERSGVIGSLERHAYVMALVGLIVFHSLEHLAVGSRARSRAAGGIDRASARALAVHVGSFAAYNALIGSLVVRRPDEGAGALVLFTAAIAVHFVVVDDGLREHHRHDYEHVVRWTLAAALLAGAAAGALVDLHEAAIGLMLAFLAGAIVLTTVKDEIPGDRQSRLAPFALGAAAYAALLLAA